jgi:FkbM family methyltransferase
VRSQLHAIAIRYIRDVRKIKTMILQPHLLLRFLKWKFIHFIPRHDVTVKTSNGLLTCDSKDWLIGKYLYVYRSYETENIRAALELLAGAGYLSSEGNAVVLDVGANIGMICIALLKQNYFKRAIAFEPGPNNFRLLTKNVAQNGLADRIDCFPYALSSIEREAELKLAPHNSGDNHLRDNNEDRAFDEAQRQTVKVPVTTLDQVCADHPDLFREKVSLIWLDIQGHEGYFFQGAQQLLSQGIPVASEFWPYGIKRAGMSTSDYCRIVTETFTHLYHFHHGHYEKMDITDIARLFEIYQTPREFGQVILVNDPG